MAPCSGRLGLPICICGEVAPLSARGPRAECERAGTQVRPAKEGGRRCHRSGQRRIRRQARRARRRSRSRRKRPRAGSSGGLASPSAGHHPGGERGEAGQDGQGSPNRRRRRRREVCQIGPRLRVSTCGRPARPSSRYEAPRSCAADRRCEGMRSVSVAHATASTGTRSVRACSIRSPRAAFRPCRCSAQPRRDVRQVRVRKMSLLRPAGGTPGAPRAWRPDVRSVVGGAIGGAVAAYFTDPERG
jgi:hypothetical protein